MSYATYISRSDSGLFYFRLRLPPPVASVLGVKEVRRSLSTKERTEAMRKALSLYEDIHRVEQATRNPGNCLPLPPSLQKYSRRHASARAYQDPRLILEKGLEHYKREHQHLWTEKTAQEVEAIISRFDFGAARKFADIADLNAQAQAWCDGQAMDRPCPEDRTVRVRDAFAQEQPLLLPLPDDDFPVAERIEVSLGKTPYARFDTNDYSVPAQHVRRSLTVFATAQRVRILDGATVVASHPRSYDRGQQIEDPAHIRALEDTKRSARQHRATDALVACVPSVKDLLVQAAAHGYSLGAVTRGLMALLQRYPAQELDQAVRDALARGVPHPNNVLLALDARRHVRGEAPPTPVQLPEHLRSRDVTVQPHRLDSYGQLTERPDDDEPECEPA